MHLFDERYLVIGLNLDFPDLNFLLAGLLSELRRLRLVLIDLRKELGVSLARFIKLTLGLLELTAECSSFQLFLHHELVERVLLLLLELALMLAHVEKARDIKLRLADRWLLDEVECRLSLLISGRLKDLCSVIRVMHLNLLALGGLLWSCFLHIASELLDWEEAGSIPYRLLMDSVRASHWEGLWVRLVNHVGVLMHLKGHLLGRDLAADVIREVVRCIHPSLIIIVNIAIPEIV